MQLVLDDFLGKCQSYLILLPLLTFLKGATLAEFNRKPEDKRTGQFNQYRSISWGNVGWEWWGLSRDAELIACFISNKIAISLLCRNLEPFDTDHLNLCEIFTAKQNKNCATRMDKSNFLKLEISTLPSFPFPYNTIKMIQSH